MKYELTNIAASITDGGDGAVVISSPGKTDYFRDICSDYSLANAPYYSVPVEGDFVFRCRVCPEFGETYDAGGILAYDSDDRWIKFAYEKTDLGYPCVVGVVTAGVSDDANGAPIGTREIWMQVVRKGDNWCLHYSHDGTAWNMVRYFRLEAKRSVRIGVFSQSPLGGGCTTRFAGIDLRERTLENIRKAE